MISQISSVSFLVYTLLCVGSWNTDSWGVVPNLGSVRELLEGVKYQCLQCKRQFSKSGQISKFHFFAPLNAAPAECRPERMPPFVPFPPPLVLALYLEAIFWFLRITF